MKTEFTAKKKIHQEGNTYIITFYCDYCSAGYTSSPITSENEDEALFIAKKRAQPYFNLCHRCGKWVCDIHYNEYAMECVECTPRP